MACLQSVAALIPDEYMSKDILIVATAPHELVPLLHSKGWTVRKGETKGKSHLIVEKKATTADFVSLFEGHLAKMLTFKFAPIHSLSTSVTKNGYTYMVYPMIQEILMHDVGKPITSGQFVDHITNGHFRLAVFPGVSKPGQNPNARYFVVTTEAPEDEIRRFAELGGLKGPELGYLLKMQTKDGSKTVFRMACTSAHISSMEGVEVVERSNFGLTSIVVLSFRGFRYFVTNIGFTPFKTGDADNFADFFSERAPVMLADYVIPKLSVEEKRSWGEIAEKELAPKPAPAEVFPPLKPHKVVAPPNAWKPTPPPPSAPAPEPRLSIRELRNTLAKIIAEASHNDIHDLETVLRQGLLLVEATRGMKYD